MLDMVDLNISLDSRLEQVSAIPGSVEYVHGIEVWCLLAFEHS